MDWGCLTPPNRCGSARTSSGTGLPFGSIENSLPKYSPMRGRPAAIFAGEKSVHDRGNDEQQDDGGDGKQRLGLAGSPQRAEALLEQPVGGIFGRI